MTNRKLCDTLGIAGCLLASLHMGLLFFGKAPAIWGVLAGLIVMLFSLLGRE